MTQSCPCWQHKCVFRRPSSSPAPPLNTDSSRYRWNPSVHLDIVKCTSLFRLFSETETTFHSALRLLEMLNTPSSKIQTGIIRSCIISSDLSVCCVFVVRFWFFCHFLSSFLHYQTRRRRHFVLWNFDKWSGEMWRCHLVIQCFKKLISRAGWTWTG